MWKSEDFSYFKRKGNGTEEFKYIQGTWRPIESLWHSLQNGQSGNRIPTGFWSKSTHLYELTVCYSSDHNLHCHHHIRQLQSILIKMEILSASLLLITHTRIFPVWFCLFTRSNCSWPWGHQGRRAAGDIFAPFGTLRGFHTLFFWEEALLLNTISKVLQF